MFIKYPKRKASFISPKLDSKSALSDELSISVTFQLKNKPKLLKMLGPRKAT
jgi:hypothetical protein